MHQWCLRDFYCLGLIIPRPLLFSVWHFVRNLTLSGKPYHSKILKNHNLHLKNGKLIIGKNLVGYPLLQMTGRDTLLIEIGQIFCRQDKMWAFTDGYTSLFNVDNKTFKAIKISQKDLYYKPENAKKQGKLIDFDSIYDKAVNRAIGYLERSGVPRHLIYINKEYFPSWFFKNQQENVIEGSEYKKYIKKNYYIIGWPILFIKKRI